MDVFKALEKLKETKQGLAGEQLKSLEIAERALKDHWFIDMEYTDRELLKKDILDLIVERYQGRAERNVLTVSFVKHLLEEVIKDLDNRPIK